MSYAFKVLIGICLLMGVASCQTTGDPTRGGIFWSERKANERLDRARAELGAIDADTARLNRKNAAMEDSVARKRRYLSE
jgi:hypothetical protein